MGLNERVDSWGGEIESSEVWSFRTPLLSLLFFCNCLCCFIFLSQFCFLRSEFFEPENDEKRLKSLLLRDPKRGNWACELQSWTRR